MGSKHSHPPETHMNELSFTIASPGSFGRSSPESEGTLNRFASQPSVLVFSSLPSGDPTVTTTQPQHQPSQQTFTRSSNGATFFAMANKSTSEAFNEKLPARQSQFLGLGACLGRVPLAVFFLIPILVTAAIFWVLMCSEFETYATSARHTASDVLFETLKAEMQTALTDFIHSANAFQGTVQILLEAKVAVPTIEKILVTNLHRYSSPRAVLIRDYDDGNLVVLRQEHVEGEPSMVFSGTFSGVLSSNDSMILHETETNGSILANGKTIQMTMPLFCPPAKSELDGFCVTTSVSTDKHNPTTVSWFHPYSSLFSSRVVRNHTAGLVIDPARNRAMASWGAIEEVDVASILHYGMINDWETKPGSIQLASGHEARIWVMSSFELHLASSVFNGLEFYLVVLTPESPSPASFEHLRSLCTGLGVGLLVTLGLLVLVLFYLLVCLPLRRFRTQLFHINDMISMLPPSRWSTELPHRHGIVFPALRDAIQTVAKTIVRSQLNQSSISVPGDSAQSDEDQAPQTMRSKEMFFAAMSHEMRTPLNACIGMAEVLLGTALDERQKECVDAILVSGYSMRQLVNDILDFSKLQANKLVLENIPFNVRECVEHSAQVVQLKADEKGLELIVLVKADVPTHAIGDPSRLRQVLFNLLSNAVKFTSKGFVAIRCRIQSGRLHFEIQDTGIGIASETVGKLFKPFVQANSSTSRKFGGSGLGLVIAQQLVHMMGGRLECNSDGLGRGSLFHFSIPLDLDISAHRISGSAPRCSIYSQASRVNLLGQDLNGAIQQRFIISVVDSNEMRSEATCELLGAMGVRFTAHSPMTKLSISLFTGAEASDIIEVVLIHFNDLGSPLLEAVRELQGPSSKRKVIAVTSIKNPLPDLVSAGAICISMPISMRKFQQALVKLDPRLQIQCGSSQDRESARSDPRTSAQSAMPTARSYETTAGGLGGACVDIDDGKPRPARFAQMNILVVDDAVLNQRVITLKLQQAGFVHVDAASSGEEALSRIREVPFTFDAILMDISMPELDGYETTRAIKLDSRYESVPIIGVTGNCMPEDIEEGLVSGMLAVLCKPINTDELLGLLEDLAATNADAPNDPAGNAVVARPRLQAMTSSARLLDSAEPSHVLKSSSNFSLPNRRRSIFSTGPSGAVFHPCAILSPTLAPPRLDPPVSPLRNG